MENKFHELPPLKRHRLIQEDMEHKHENYGVYSLSCLPAKKRKQSRDPPPPTIRTPTAFCLPAKKRVWAPHSNIVLDNPVSPFDLNVEYKSPFGEEEINAKEVGNIPVVDIINEIEEHEEAENVSLAKNVNDMEENEGDDVDVDDGIECAVCQSTDGHPSDPIVFCDGCDLMVHSTCYGSPLVKGIPDGDWFCAQCLASQSDQIGNGKGIGNIASFSCCLCPVTGGAMRPTNDGRWAHIVCAVFVPEVFFTDPEGREGIDFSRVPNRRWEQSCYVCHSGTGCAIDCSELKCPLAFHVGCGLKEDLCIEYREERNKGAVVAGFCKKHTELWKKQQGTGKFKIVARE